MPERAAPDTDRPPGIRRRVRVRPAALVLAASVGMVGVSSIALMAAVAAAAPSPDSAVSLTVAAASDLQAVLPLITARFQKETGHAAALTFGSSGNFFTQIQNGAPFDVFLSADIDYPRQLEQSGLAERGSLYVYATGRIVLWTPNDSRLDLSRGLPLLADSSVHRVAIANPEHAPYGRAAVAALRHAGVYHRVQSKLVRGENISQAAQFVQSGNAEVGVLALSLARAPALARSGRYVEIPDAFYPRLEQAAVVVASSRQQAAARQFVEYLKRSDTVQTLTSFGFLLPPDAGR